MGYMINTILAAPVDQIGAAAKMAAVPVPLSSVKLTGDWADKQLRNQEVLMSLNMSQWKCHFTTAANLTACVQPAGTWHTYEVNASVAGGFNPVMRGFLGAGDDALPAATVTLGECKSRCQATASCKGFTFRDFSATPTHHVKCSWKTAFHFTGSARSNCIAAGGDGKPSCSPLPGEMGLGGYYGHYQGHWMSATAMLYNNTGNETVRARAADAVSSLNRVMSAWRGKYGEDTSPSPVHIW